MPGDCIIPVQVTFDKDGYPRKKFGGRIWRMNRWMWTLVYGEIPQNLVVAHRCNNKKCINPHHLYLTSAEQNSTDAARDGLYNPSIRFTLYDCEVMFEMYNDGLKQREIAELYKTSQSTISDCLDRYRKAVGDAR